MTTLIRGPLREARSKYFDSRGWDDFQARSDDVVIATYPKCGTTWTQRIVGMLIFQSDEPFPVQDSSPWPDFRLPPPGAMHALAESQTHRRFLKSHLPFDALPVYEGVKYIHVARDGRDAAMSFHNHKLNYTDQVIARAAEVLADDPKFDTGISRADPDPAAHFHAWLQGEEDHIGDPACGFWHIERSFWDARDEPNVLLVHYGDMKADLEGEMRRIAEFLDIDIPEELWPRLTEAARFESMKGKAEELMPTAGEIWQGGGNTFLNKGFNGRWRGVFHEQDLDLYDAKVKNEFAPDLARWIEYGRLGMAG
ncbi:MAG: sulfotransferase domain-containing protein [Gammaproteobacteria bacterium]|nr:sulfotransferase domain-containing protein [Pseudomonadales bacterium]MCP5348036.1 sulfotransferase domain-containing protein [Pseudomonadales bacterium]